MEGTTLWKLDSGWLKEAVTSLLPRSCYSQLYDEIISSTVSSKKVFLVKGSPGIGKSLFICYFMYRVVREHLSHPSNSPPTFVISDLDGHCFFFSHDASGNPLVQPWTATMPIPTYLLSDTKVVSTPFYGKGYIHVTSIANHNYETLEKEAGESGRVWNMELFTFEEYLHISEHNHTISRFQFDVFGGSARLLKSKAQDVEDKSVYEVVEKEFESFFNYVDYSFDDGSSSTSSSSSVPVSSFFSSSMSSLSSSSATVKELVGDVWNETIRVITRAIVKPSKNDGGASVVDQTRKSVFMLRYVDTSKNPVECSNQFASPFMQALAATICTTRTADIFVEIAKLFGKSGEGIVFERLAHQHLFESLQSGSALSAFHICGKGNKRKPNLKIQFPSLKRKVFIRKIEDISRLVPYEDYGIPIIPNFPLVDSIIAPNILFQMTVSESHKGAISKFESIENALKKVPTLEKPVLAMVFVLGDNFEGFKKVLDLQVDQYKYQFIAGHVVAKRKIEEDGDVYLDHEQRVESAYRRRSKRRKLKDY